MSDTAHVYPINDLIEHDLDDEHDCPCGPEVQLSENNVWIIVHHSLDGREKHERNEGIQDPPT